MKTQKELKTRTINGVDYNYFVMKDGSFEYRTDFMMRLTVDEPLKYLFLENEKMAEIITDDLKEDGTTLTILGFTVEHLDYLTALVFEKDGLLIGHKITPDIMFFEYMQEFIIKHKGMLAIEFEGSCLDYLDDENYKGILSNYYSPQSLTESGLTYKGENLELGHEYKVTNILVDENSILPVNLKLLLQENDFTEIIVNVNDKVGAFNYIGSMNFKDKDGTYYKEIEESLKTANEWEYSDNPKSLDDFQSALKFDDCYIAGYKLNMYYNMLNRRGLSKEEHTKEFNARFEKENKILDKQLAELEEYFTEPFIYLTTKNVLLSLLNLPEIELTMLT